MASKACASCLRTFQRNSRSIPQTRKPLTFTTTRSFTRHDIFQGELPEPNATPATSIPPVTPQRAEGAAKSPSAPLSTKAAAELRKFAGKATETYTAYGTTEALYKACAELADYSIPQARDLEAEMPKTDDGEDLGVGSGWWHTEIGLQPTFSTWSQVTMLHMYFLAARFRCFDASESQIWQQHLLDHFFYDAENRMVINHNMHARGTRNKYLKDMFIQWRGLIAAYDEGVMQGDAVLAAAVWRNIFKANEEVDVRILATIVSYMRKSLKMLEAATDHEVSIGQLKFCNPKEEAKLVLAPSPMLKLPFKKAPGSPAAPQKTPKKA